MRIVKRLKFMGGGFACTPLVPVHGMETLILLFHFLHISSFVSSPQRLETLCSWSLLSRALKMEPYL